MCNVQRLRASCFSVAYPSALAGCSVLQFSFAKTHHAVSQEDPCLFFSAYTYVGYILYRCGCGCVCVSVCLFASVRVTSFSNLHLLRQMNWGCNKNTKRKKNGQMTKQTGSSSKSSSSSSTINPYLVMAEPLKHHIYQGANAALPNQNCCHVMMNPGTSGCDAHISFHLPVQNDEPFFFYFILFFFVELKSSGQLAIKTRQLFTSLPIRQMRKFLRIVPQDQKPHQPMPMGSRHGLCYHCSAWHYAGNMLF